jgi:hypothetical protein
MEENASSNHASLILGSIRRHACSKLLPGVDYICFFILVLHRQVNDVALRFDFSQIYHIYLNFFFNLRQ